MWGIIKNWKILAGGGVIVLLIAIGAVLVSNHQTIEKQKAQLASKELMLNQVESALKTSLDTLETEREARDKADIAYQKSLERKQREVAKLTKAIDEVKDNDETFKQCMEYRVPDSVFDSLYGQSNNSDRDSD